MAVENSRAARDQPFIYPHSPRFRAQAPYIALQRLKRHVRRPNTARAVGHILHERHKNQLLVSIPKVGTRTIRAALITSPISQEIVEYETTLTDVLNRMPSGATIGITAVVRNPWARAYSAWSDKIARLDTVGDRARRIARHKGLWAGMPFAAFVDWLASPAGSDAEADRHWMSQYKFFATDRAHVKIEKLETLGSELSLFGRSFPLKQENATDPSRARYKRAYTPALVDIIATRYATDIKTFGYCFD